MEEMIKANKKLKQLPLLLPFFHVPIKAFENERFRNNGKF